ncbi:MAG TPA: T9SS type A sorting domain-containing protein [Candidatus Kryptonia bacterium]
MRTTILIYFCLLGRIVHAQSSAVSVAGDSNYKSWGWNAIVLNNGLITHATVPAIGGRVMQYDLGELPSVFINSSEVGNVYSPKLDGQWHNFGGYKTWPAPQSAWNTGGWPPPPNLDYGNYSVLDTVSWGDSASVSVLGPVEQWYAPGIRFLRKATVYKGTSRVRMDQTMINQGPTDASWSMWSITQSIVSHPGRTDYGNYWAYFPINPNSVYGPTGVSPQGGNSQAWKGEVAPGIYGVQFATLGAKIYADPDKGWIAYSDVSDTVTFIRTFDVYDTAQYPDSGARVSVYVSGSAPPIYMEIEVKGPIVDLPASGGQYTFTENWWAAKMRGPVLCVDSVGAIADSLTYNPNSHLLSGDFGVFYAGTVKAVFLDSGGGIVSGGETHQITPLEEFQLNEFVTIPDSAKTVQLVMLNKGGDTVGILESEEIRSITTSVKKGISDLAASFELSPNYPNPFNGGTVIKFHNSKTAGGSLKIFDILGREIATLASGKIDAGYHTYVWNPENLPSGIYFARMQVEGKTLIQKMAYLR